MDFFEYRDGELYCEDVKVEDIAAAVGTPTYIYSRGSLLARYGEIRDSFSDAAPIICYSVKANSNLAVLKALADEGAGFDIVSGGELFRALRAGGDPSKIVFAGVAKKDGEIEYALDNDILMFNVESRAELSHINGVARRMGKTARVAIRLNPDVDPKTHVHTTTGKKENKFGVDLESAERIISDMSSFPAVRLIGLHAHIGSPVYETQPYVDAITKLNEFARKCSERAADNGVELRYINTGGGLCISYTGERVSVASDYAKAIAPLIKESGLQMIMEPGRYIVGNSGILVTRVIYRKDVPDFKSFVICDAAMNDLIRPALYDAFHLIWPATSSLPLPDPEDAQASEARRDETEVVDIVGPVCESADFLAKDRAIPHVEDGDLLSVFSAGAYGFTMSSNYNSRPRACEVMVDGGDFTIVRERESYEDLIAKERLV